jgi:putative ABC transport system ATP-binding protein
MALLELERSPTPERAGLLHETLKRNLTNLKGSAATVNLPCVEDLAFALITELHAMRGKPQITRSKSYAVLRQNLELLSSVIRVLTIAERKTAVIEEIERMARQVAYVAPAAVSEQDRKPVGRAVMEVKNLRKVYREGKMEVVAVDSISLTLRGGEMVAVLGPSGSGKTTLLSMMGFLLTPTAGTITLLGQRVDTHCESALPRLRRQHIGFVFQTFNLLASLSALDNVLVALRLKGQTGKPARREAEGLLERVGLAHRMHFLPRDLSGGEKQRVAIARALTGSPSLILADEPTANLDSKSGHEVIELLREMANDGPRAVIVVTHDTRNLHMLDRIIRLEDGRLLGGANA